MSRMLICLTVLQLLLMACAQGQSSPAPPDIRYGEDICIECNMIISDVRFAAAYSYEVEPGRYENKAFDDIGGMLLHADNNPNDSVAVWYVHDYASEDWLDVADATFIMSPDLPTPMGYGIIAYADAATARTRADEVEGMVMTWDELRAAGVDHGH